MVNGHFCVTCVLLNMSMLYLFLLGGFHVFSGNANFLFYKKFALASYLVSLYLHCSFCRNYETFKLFFQVGYPFISL